MPPVHPLGAAVGETGREERAIPACGTISTRANAIARRKRALVRRRDQPSADTSRLLPPVAAEEPPGPQGAGAEEPGQAPSGGPTAGPGRRPRRGKDRLGGRRTPGTLPRV